MSQYQCIICVHLFIYKRLQRWADKQPGSTIYISTQYSHTFVVVVARNGSPYDVDLAQTLGRQTCKSSTGMLYFTRHIINTWLKKAATVRPGVTNTKRTCFCAFLRIFTLDMVSDRPIVLYTSQTDWSRESPHPPTLAFRGGQKMRSDGTHRMGMRYSPLPTMGEGAGG